MKNISSSLCAYYQALIPKEKHWLLTSLLRSFEHLAFDRTCDTQSGIFEFFVPADLENQFLMVMKLLENEGIVFDLQKLENPLADNLL